MISLQVIDENTVYEEKQEIEEEEEIFKIKFTYNHCCELDDTEKQVTSITFNVSRYGKYTKTLRFENPITVKETVELVEKYFSEPITQKFYEVVKDDLWWSDEPWDVAQKNYDVKGNVLTDNVYLESYSVRNGKLRLSIGS